MPKTIRKTYEDEAAIFAELKAMARHMNGIKPRGKLPHGAMTEAMRKAIRLGLAAYQEECR